MARRHILKMAVTCMLVLVSAGLFIIILLKLSNTSTDMDMISWTLDAIDKVFSTRKRGSGEPGCPDGTIAAGYVRDSWDKWRIMCLSVLSIEDVEDIYLFGTVIARHLLIGLGITLVYRQIRKAMAATQGAQRLFIAMESLGRGLGTQTVAISELNRKMDHIMEKLAENLNLIEIERNQHGQIEQTSHCF
ncbi:uncharacterized protein [Nerophis lumbriciformis]|uniref:uncharacterized protein isoform X3 n=1 Tax=Nerophis lumbriciformis TaxID=546530 RepID=UPI003BABAA30